MDVTETIQTNVEGVDYEYRLRICTIDKSTDLTGRVYYKTLSAPLEQARPEGRADSIPIIRVHAETVFHNLLKEAKELKLP